MVSSAASGRISVTAWILPCRSRRGGPGRRAGRRSVARRPWAPRGSGGAARRWRGRLKPVASRAPRTASRSRVPVPSSRCSWTSRTMSSTCTLPMSGPATAMDASGLRGSLHTRWPRSRVSRRCSGSPSRRRSSSASSTVSTCMPGSGSKQTVTSSSCARSSTGPRPSVSRRQPSSALAPSGRTPDQHDIASAPSSAAMRTARVRSSTRGPRSPSLTRVGSCLCHGSRT